MSDLRVVYDNAVARATLSASTSASASMGVGNLAIDKKSSVWRATAKNATLRAVWSSLERIGCVALPFCNLSPTAAMRVRVTSEIQTSNNLKYSQQFNNGVWVPGTNGSVSADSVLAPDGTMTADAYTHGTSSGAFAYLAQTLAANASQTWTFSMWVKVPSGTSSLALVFSNVTGTTKNGNLQAVNTTWKRLTFTLTAGQLADTGQLGVGVGGTAGQVYHVWGAQLEPGAVATSYYPTTSTALTRPLGYMDDWQDYTNFGYVAPCPDAAVKLRGWTAAQSAGAYAYGGGAFARVWIPQSDIYGMVIDITDNDNLQGYIEAAVLVAGPYWSTTYNASEMKLAVEDTATISRSESGDQLADPGTISRSVAVDLAQLPPADLPQFLNLVLSSKVYPILLSAFSQVAGLERNGMVYGRRTKDTEMALNFAFNYTTSVAVASI